MKEIAYTYKPTPLYTDHERDSCTTRLKKPKEQIQAACSEKYNSVYASLHAPFDTAAIQNIIEISRTKKNLNPRMLIVIGIGGSNLGTCAIHEAINGTLYNDTNPPILFYCADTVDALFLKTLLSLVQASLEKNEACLILIVSKSGTTTETIANGSLFVDLLKRYYPHTWHNYVVAITDSNSALEQFAHHHKIQTLSIPPLIGGRYSVLSAVGLFPLSMLGINIHELCKGAQDAIEKTFADQNVYAAKSACMLYSYYTQGYTVHDTFVFSTQLESYGKWYRQLCAESLGKEYTTDGIYQPTGITPTVSVGSTDLHSVGQLYLSGPHTTITTFVSINQNQNLYVKPIEKLDTAVPNIQNKSIDTVMHAIISGTCTAYEKNNRPFIHVMLPDLSAYNCGMIMQYSMLQIMYLGYLLKVNPFDQPNVELYKKETRKMLGS